MSRKNIKTYLAYAHQINLCFGNAARVFTDFRSGFLAGNFMGQFFCFCRKSRVQKYSQAQSVTARVLLGA